jgi:glucokinase-like ROK family protein
LADVKPPRSATTAKKQPPSSPFILSNQEAEIVHALRKHGTVSRTDIARMTGWSRAKVTNEVSRFIRNGLLVEVGEGSSLGGRRPRLVAINRRLGYVVGVDIGATSVDLALADLDVNVLQRYSQPADVREKPETLLGEISQRILELAAQQGVQPQQILGIGVGVPGPVEFSRGVLVAPPLMPAWEGFPIREFLRTTFPAASVMVDNDVNIMALGELYAGAGVGVDNFIYVKIGTGIGAGIISDGKIHRGSSGSAGDIGHIGVDHNGPICRCGNVGCLEAMAAGPAIAIRAMEAAQSGQSAVLAKRMETSNGVLRAEDVSAAAREGDRIAIEIIQRSGRLIGDVLAGLVNFFNPRLILIGGGVSNIGNQMLASIRQAVLLRSTALATRDLTINYSPMGTEAGVMGAIHLALEHVFVVQEKVEGET